jgi:hypothetical protein
MYTYEQVRIFLLIHMKKRLVDDSIVLSYANTMNIFGDCFIPKDYSSTGKKEYFTGALVNEEMLLLAGRAA